MTDTDPKPVSVSPPLPDLSRAEPPVTANSTAAWYYSAGAGWVGPVTWDDLRARAALGELAPTSRVWRDGLPGEVPAASVSDLFPRPSAPAPIAPAAGQVLMLPPTPARAPARRGLPAWAWATSAVVLVVAVCAGVTAFAKKSGSPATAQAPGTPDEPESPPSTPFTSLFRPPARPTESAKPAPAKADITTEQIVARSEKSVALIRGPGGHGTGFVVAPNVIATNAHVVADSGLEELEVLFPTGGEEGKAPRKIQGLLCIDHARDLALLSVEVPFPALPLAANYEFRRGQAVTTIGNPGAVGGQLVLKTAVSSGILSTETKLDNQDYWQLDMTVNPGNSGGPVFDSTGHVIGVVAAKSLTEERVSFCIPWAAVRDAVSKVSAITPEERERLTATHTAAALFRRIGGAGRQYGKWMELYATVAREALDTRRSVPDAVSICQDTIRRDYEMLGRLLKVSETERLLDAPGWDAKLPEGTRKRLKQCFRLCLDMKKRVEMPSGSVTDFEFFTRTLNDEFDQLTSALTADIGVRLPR